MLGHREEFLMDLTSWWQQSLVGAIGGCACELLHWYSLSRTPGKIEQYSNQLRYWITTLGMILLGGFMPLLYLKGTTSAVLCFHLGAATPVLLEKLIAVAPTVANRQGGGPSLRGFFSW
jgi:hypothetical protein